MSVKVISISKENERILSFLYPTYAITDSPSVVSKFISHRDIKSKRERESLDLRFDDCIFISTQLFDEVWDEDKIKQEAIDFARVNFKSRRKTIPSLSDNFVDDIINFIFEITSEEEESSLLELFDTFGSVNFIKTFFLKSITIPVSVISKALNTFVTKILKNDTSVYFKKKSIIYSNKIRTNLQSSIDSYLDRVVDNYGLSVVKFYFDLYQ